MTASSPPRKISPTATSSSPQGQDVGRLAIDLGKVDRGQAGQHVFVAPRHARAAGLQAVRRRRLGDRLQCGAEEGHGPREMRLEARRGRRYPHRRRQVAGGQYGVSISDPAGAIGKYRYLLFDISCDREGRLLRQHFLQRNQRDRRGRGRNRPNPRRPRWPRADLQIARFGPLPDHHRLYRRAGTQGLGGEEAPAHGGQVVPEDR